MNQHERPAAYEDEINLYDYWKVIVKRKTLIIGLFLIAVLASAAISFSKPKIYRGEVILKLPSISAKELISIINTNNTKDFFPTARHLVTGVKLTALKDSNDKLQLTIEAKNTDVLPHAAAEFVAYVNKIPFIKLFIEQESQRLLKQSEELSKVVEESNKSSEIFKKLFKEGRIMTLGFNPIELSKKISDIKIEKLAVEQSLQRFRGAEIIESPYITQLKQNTKRSMALTGILSLFAGIFLAFFAEYIEKMRKKNVSSLS